MKQLIYSAGISVITMTKTKQDYDLTKDEDYYSNGASWLWMGVSQYKDFMKCEAAAFAKLKQDWQPTSDPQALLVGNYVHSYFESKEAHEEFKENNSDKLFKKNGDLYKAFEVAEDMIQRLDEWPLFKFLWQGEREVPVTGELYGAEWKGKIDCLNVDKGYFVDIKTTADIHKRFYSKKYAGWTNFAQEYGYALQMGVYQELLKMQYGKEFKGYILAVSKQDPPEVAAIEFRENDIEFEMHDLKLNIERIEQVKNGEIEPKPCGTCEYCRGHYNPEAFVFADELID